MINRHYRFHGYNSLKGVYSRGQSVRCDIMTLRYLANPRRQNFRLAIVVSRKVNKSAVVRNRIRRRLYELIRGYKDQITHPHDIVISVFSDQIAEMNSKELEKMLDSLLINAHLISPKTTPRHDIVKSKEI